MHECIIFAGFGGQGIQSMSKILAKASMEQGLEVTWMPAYGGAMRGGTSNVTVNISDKLIGSPMPNPGDITVGVVMNNPSMDKFESYVKPGGLLFVNSSLIDVPATRGDITYVYVPVNDIALELGNDRVANMVMLGALLEKTRIVPLTSLVEYVESVFATKPQVVEANKQAIEKGVEYARK